MTIAWITAGTESQLIKTLCAGPWKIRAFAATDFVSCNVLMPRNTNVIVIDVIDRTLLNLCQEICRQHMAPVLAIVLDLAYAQAALEVGADDFMVAPADPIEMLLRLQKLARMANIVRVGHLEIDLASWTVRSQSHPINLSRIEYLLLASLARRVGQMVNPTTILDEVRALGSEYLTFAQLKSYIARLQKKIEPDFHHPQYITSIPGIGYRLRNHRQWEARQVETASPGIRLQVSS
jgi:two-component system response regulator MtrA